MYSNFLKANSCLMKSGGRFGLVMKNQKNPASPSQLLSSNGCYCEREYAVVMNKTVQVTKPKAEKTKSNFAKSQDALKKQKVQQVQQKSEKDYISDKTQLEKTLKLQELIGKYTILKKTECSSEQEEQFKVDFFRKLVQYPNFIYMNMLEAGNSIDDPSILGNVNIFTSKLKYDQYIERFESKLLKKEYASVKVSHAPNIAQILAATSSTSSLDVLTATIDDSVKLVPSELKQVMEWTSIVWTELLFSVLIKSLKEHEGTANELKNLDIELQKVSIDLKQNKGSFLAMQNKYQKLIEEKVKLLQSQEVKSTGYKSRLYLTEKIYVAQRDAENINEVDKFAIPSRKDPSKKIVYIYSAPDVAVKDIHNFIKTANDNSVSIAVVSGAELFEFLVRNKIDILRISFLGNYDDLVTHKLRYPEIEEIAEIGKREAERQHCTSELNRDELASKSNTNQE